VNQIERFDFHGTELVVIPTDEGLFVSVKRVCEALGIDPKTQREKLQAAPWAVGGLIPSTGTDGKRYEMFAVHLDTLPMWLAGIDAGRVAEHVRPVLVLFQKEAARALRDHFLRPKSDPVAALLKKSPAELLQLAADLAREGELAKQRASAAEAEIAVLAPKAEVADRIADTDGLHTLSEAGKMLGFGLVTFCARLRQEGILMMANNLPYETHRKAGRFEVKERPYWCAKHGAERLSATTFVTGKGLVWLAERLAPASSARPVAALPLLDRVKGGR
jgi:phage antirepressor YoqD-like protein